MQEIECASGQSAQGRVVPPEVDYGDDAVIITVRVRQVDGGADCQGDPDTPYALDLEEPLRGRPLLDGGRTPPPGPHDRQLATQSLSSVSSGSSDSTTSRCVARVSAT